MTAAVDSLKKAPRAKRKRAQLLNARTATAVRRIARALLDDVRRTRRRLDAKRHPMALHAFRVALRRLRSTLQIYRPVLDENAVPRKLRRGLKRLARATGAARDAEVGLLWLRRARAQMGDAERAACDRLTTDWKRRRAASYKEIRKELKQKFDTFDARLTKVFSGWIVDPTTPALGPTVSKLLLVQVSALSTALQQITSVSDTAAIHAARVEGKRLRYVLEPLMAELPNGPVLLKSLKHFQDEFGELCDRQILSEELMAAARRHDSEQTTTKLRSLLGYDSTAQPSGDAAVIGLLDLGRRLQLEREQHYAAIAQRYLGEHEPAFVAPYREAAQQLAGPH